MLGFDEVLVMLVMFFFTPEILAALRLKHWCFIHVYAVLLMFLLFYVLARWVALCGAAAVGWIVDK